MIARILILAWLSVAACGCVAAIPQPGQTPAQVQACSNDATWHNVTMGAAGVLSTGAATEAAVASQTPPKTAQGLAVAGIVTSAAAGVATLVSQLLARAYAVDGCAPALVGRPKQAMRDVVFAPVEPVR